MKPIIPADNLPVFAIGQRAKAANMSFEDAKTSPLPGYALGQLLSLGIIDRAQHDAGLRFEQDWVRWARMAGLPSHQQRTPTGGTVPQDPDGEEWEEAKKRFDAARDSVSKIQPSRLVWSCLETVIMDGVTRHITNNLGSGIARKAFVDGMDGLVKHYKIGRDERKDGKA